MSTQPVSEGAAAIVEHIKKGAPDLDLCLISQGGDCRDFKGCTDHAARVLAAIIDRNMREETAKRNAEWLREIQAHPEFGGRNLDRASESVARLFLRFSSPLLLAQVRQMELQNWPEMFYFLARIAAEIDRLKRKEGEGCKGK